MKKIMFNDRYGSTEAVLQGMKTVIRRLVKPTKPRSLANCLQGVKYECMVDENDNQYEAPYYVGEIVAVAQCYKDAGIDFIPNNLEKPRKWGFTHRMKAWLNKMFVYADLMPHQIRILDVRAERLQDITEEDCLREGIYSETVETDYFHYHDPENNYYCADCEGKGRERLIDEALKDKGRFGFDGMDEELIRQELNGYSSDDPHESAKICDICRKYLSGYKYPNDSSVFYDPDEAFAALINKISGRGTWDSNPYCWVINFELIK